MREEQASKAAGRLRRRVVVDVAVVGLAVGLGFGGWKLFHAVADDDNSYESVPTAAGAFDVGEPGNVVLPEPPSAAVPPPDGGGAATAEDAVAGFLAAEAAGEWDASWLFLSAADRAVHQTAAGWVQAHGYMATITGFDVAGVEDESSAAVTVQTVTDYQPLVDEVRGLVPAHADVAWHAVMEDGRWWVSVSNSEVTPEYPSDDVAGDAVLAWIAQRQECGESVQSATLVGSPAIVDELCGSEGRATLGDAAHLDAVDGAVVAATFGESAAAAARTIDVRGPVALRVVVAPLGESWLVVGVLAPSG